MSAANEFDIAIVGMSGRFPGAPTLIQFWKNLSEGIESITRFSEQELLEAGIPQTWISDSRYVKAAPVLADPGAFDADFFHLAPAEARAMDPQHRVLLELAYAALEDAGYDAERYAGRVGVFTGSALNTYFLHTVAGTQLAEEYIPTLIGADKDFLSSRIAYKLNLRGPSVTIQTACSTSIVAVHLARQSLLCHETDMVLVGGISIRVPHRAGYFFDGGGVVSADGRVRAFDARANGTVFGSGGGILVLKRLTDALSDDDTVHAVIKGSAVNNDGSNKAGYTAPSVSGQAEAIIETLANAAIEAESIGYVEAHGSGTPVGDPIEIRALTKAFRTFTKRSGYCAIGSVKTNIGHLDAAAGVAGIIKTVLSLKNRKIPPSLHFEQPNPEINFPETPFFVNTTLREWTSEGPRRAGVMSTGMGGTNAYLIIEEAPPVEDRSESMQPQLLVLSARTESALDQSSHFLQTFLSSGDSVRIADVAHTLQMGRKSFPYRRYLVCSTREEAITSLRLKDSKELHSERVDESVQRPVVLLLPGVGDQYVGMGQDLYKQWEVFTNQVDRCAEILYPHLGLDVRKLLYPEGHEEKKNSSRGIDLRKLVGRNSSQEDDFDTVRLDRTRFVQPALFTVEYALAQLWASLGVTPDAILGHSMGEYVAACLAGVFSLEDALRLVAVRARLADALPSARMLAIMLSERELMPRLPRGISIALINSPNLCVVAGPAEQVDAFESSLQQDGAVCRPVRNGHAFHSPMLNPILAAFEAEIRNVRLKEPKTPFLSNVTGTWITPFEATDAKYWLNHATQPARFDLALHQLWQMKDAVLVEAGPGRTLSVLAMQHPDQRSAEKPIMVSSLRHFYENRSDTELLWHSIGKLWSSGATIRWESTPRTGQRRISLPTYPFECRNYWAESKSSESQPPVRLTSSTDLEGWLYGPTWERATPIEQSISPALGQGDADWLVFADSEGEDYGVRATLQSLGKRCVFVRFGEKFAERQESAFELNPDVAEDYISLFRRIQERLPRSLHVLHWGGFRTPGKPTLQSVRFCQKFAFYSLFYMAQAVGELGISIPIKMALLSDQLHQVTGNENLDPSMATVLGLSGVIRKEFPNIIPFNIDLDTKRVTPSLAAAVMSEFGSEPQDVIVYRGRYRWFRKYQPIELRKRSGNENQAPDLGCLRPGGVYLITGGTGGIGLTIAKHLAEVCQPKIVLTKRTPFPEKSQWKTLQNRGNAPEHVLKIINELLAIEALGAEVEIGVADCADIKQMQALFDHVLSKFGHINGVIHSAGMVKAGLIQSKTRSTVEATLAPKVYGGMVLLELLKGVKPDFLVLFSSMTSIVTPFALSDYSAANAFLDALTCVSNAQQRFHTLTINWPGWREVGQIVNLEASAGVDQWKQEALKKAISTRAGVEAFRRALDSGQTHVILSPENLEGLLRDSQMFDAAKYLLPENSGTKKRVEKGQRALDLPTDALESALAEIWCGTFGVEQIGVHDNFFEIGGHSLLAARIVSRIDRKFGKRLSIASIFRAPTIAQLAATLRGVPAPHVIPLNAGKRRRVSLFWLGGGAIYRALAQHLEDDLAMISISLPDDSLSTLTRPYALEEIARRLAGNILEVQAEGPYFLGAWCLPGLLAYETARQLELQGRGKSLVVLVDTPISIDDGRAASVLTRLKRRMKLESFHLSRLWNMPRESRSKYVRARFEWMKQLWRYQRLKIGYNTATEDRTSEPFFGEIQFLAALRYIPPSFGGRVLFLQPQHRPADLYWDLSSGWKKLLGELDIFEVPGDHTSMFEEPNVGILAERIRTAIRDLQWQAEPPQSVGEIKVYASTIG